MTKQEKFAGYIIGLALFVVGCFVIVRSLSVHDMSFGGFLVQIIGVLMLGFGGVIILSLLNQNN